MLVKRTLAAVGLSVLALTSLSACGESRPSADEVSKVLQEGDNADATNEEAADCVAEALVDSDLSDETLRKIVDTKGEYFDEDENKLPKEDQEVVKSDEFIESFSKCLDLAMPEGMDDTDAGVPAPPAPEDSPVE